MTQPTKPRGVSLSPCYPTVADYAQMQIRQIDCQIKELQRLRKKYVKRLEQYGGGDDDQT